MAAATIPNAVRPAARPASTAFPALSHPWTRSRNAKLSMASFSDRRPYVLSRGHERSIPMTQTGDRTVPSGQGVATLSQRVPSHRCASGAPAWLAVSVVAPTARQPPAAQQLTSVRWLVCLVLAAPRFAVQVVPFRTSVSVWYPPLEG